MTLRSRFSALAASFALSAALCTTAASAFVIDGDRSDEPSTAISFVQFSSPNLAAPGSALTIKGKLSVPSQAPAAWLPGWSRKKVPAVLILHGSSGVDQLGDFYQTALNEAGFATLQIDMWEARGVTGIANRPGAPILTYPDAFSALAFLAGRPEIDGARVGVIGFSWGGVMALGSAERLYAGLFGGGRTFKAHVANYPVCWGANNTALTSLLHTTPAQFGSQFLNLTGAPVLIQVGTNDDYDRGTGPCKALAQAANANNGGIVSVQEYPGAYHGWDRLMVPVNVADPFGNLGSYFSTGVVPIVRIVPDVDQAYESRERAVRFFKRRL